MYKSFSLFTLLLFIKISTINASNDLFSASSKMRGIFSCTFSLITGNDINLKERVLNKEDIFLTNIESSKVSEFSFGTGFSSSIVNISQLNELLIDAEKTYILTNFHVIENALIADNQTYVCSGNNGSSCAKSNIEYIDKLYDLAIISIPKYNQCENVKFNYALSPFISSNAFTLSNKFAIGISYSSASISLPNKNFITEDGRVSKFHLINSNVSYGSSGSALFSNAYEFLGIIKGMYDSGSFLALTIPVSEIILSVERIKQMKQMEEDLDFKILEKGDLLFLEDKNNNKFFKKIDINSEEPIYYINKQQIKLKADLIYILFNFLNNEKVEHININTLTKENRFRKIKLEKLE